MNRNHFLEFLFDINCRFALTKILVLPSDIELADKLDIVPDLSSFHTPAKRRTRPRCR